MIAWRPLAAAFALLVAAGGCAPHATSTVKAPRSFDDVIRIDAFVSAQVCGVGFAMRFERNGDAIGNVTNRHCATPVVAAHVPWAEITGILEGLHLQTLPQFTSGPQDALAARFHFIEADGDYDVVLGNLTKAPPDAAAAVTKLRALVRRLAIDRYIDVR